MLIGASIFYKFVSNQKKMGEFKTIPQSQVDFIKTYHIQYGIISKNASLSDNMKGIITRTIDDDISGEKFVLFNNNSFLLSLCYKPLQTGCTE